MEFNVNTLNFKKTPIVKITEFKNYVYISFWKKETRGYLFYITVTRNLKEIKELFENGVIYRNKEKFEKLKNLLDFNIKV